MAKEVLSVFTEKYTKIENRLLNKIVLSSGEQSNQALAQWDTVLPILVYLKKLLGFITLSLLEKYDQKHHQVH